MSPGHMLSDLVESGVHQAAAQRRPLDHAAQGVIRQEHRECEDTPSPRLPADAIVGVLRRAAAKQYWVYIGTYTGPQSKGIYASKFDADTGKLEPPCSGW